MNSDNCGDPRDVIEDLAIAGLDDDLIFANMAILRVEKSGRSVVDHAPISEVAVELRRHRVLDSKELLTKEVILFRHGTELIVVGKSHDDVVAEWKRVVQATRGAGMELHPWDDPSETELNGWEPEVAGFGFGVADNKVSISIGAAAYDILESHLERAACSTNPHLSARYGVECWLRRNAPGLEAEDKAETIDELNHVVRRSGFATVISDLELSSAFDRALQRWVIDRDVEHPASFLRSVDEWSSIVSR